MVEVTLKFAPTEDYDQSKLKSMVHEVLLMCGLLSTDEVFPLQALADDRLGFYTSLLMQTKWHAKHTAIRMMS